MSAAILMFHRVAEHSPDTFGLCTPAARFREHLAHVAARTTPLPLDELARAAAGRRLPARAVAITLDDGYLDNLLAASPLLAELGLPATFFVSSARLDERREFWWDALEHALLGPHAVPPELELDRALPTVTRADRLAAFRAAHALALGRGVVWRDALVARVLAWSGADAAPRESHRALLPDELRELAARPGHTIGAHTANHLLLPAHERAVQRREIAGDKAALERVLARPVTLFSYPFGAHDDGAVELVRELGFAAAVTVENRPLAPGDGAFRLPRLEVKPDPGAEFAARLDALLG